MPKPEPLYRIVYYSGRRGRTRTWSSTLAMLRQLRFDRINLSRLRVERV